MADVDGDFVGLDTPSTSHRGGVDGETVTLPQGSTVPTRKFQMRGWSTTYSDWRTWVSYGTPDPTPPLAYGTVVGVTSAAFWE